jgi:hypothetical protein
MYKIRIILDTKEDIIRTVLVNDSINLERLHTIVVSSFGFAGQEMASFYKTDDEWNQGKEIPLFNMAEAGEEISMQSCILNETLPEENNKLISDFMGITNMESGQWSITEQMNNGNSTNDETTADDAMRSYMAL